MEPRIRYAKTDDGVSIAYATVGEGHPIVLMSAWPFCHLDAEWSIPTRRYYEEFESERDRLQGLGFEVR